MKLFGRKNTETAPVTAPKALMDPELGIPYGEPGSAERLNWIFADQERSDREDQALQDYLSQQG